MKLIPVMPSLAMCCAKYAFAPSPTHIFEWIEAPLSKGTFMQHAHTYMNAERSFWLSARWFD